MREGKRKGGEKTVTIKAVVTNTLAVVVAADVLVKATALPG